MNTKQYDIIVLGFGKAGKTLAAKFGSMGKSVAMIEENPLMYGGTCINIACIPTKTMIIAASKGLSYDQVLNQREVVTSRLRNKNFGMLDTNEHVDVYTGHGEFISNKEIAVTAGEDKIILSADTIVINTGAVAIKPNISGIDTATGFYNSTEIQQLPTQPSTLGVIGAGPIGLEFASLYAKLGAKVTVFNIESSILKREEPIVQELATEYLTEQGIEMKKQISFLGDDKDIEEKLSQKFEISENAETLVVSKLSLKNLYNISNAIYENDYEEKIIKFLLENKEIIIIKEGIEYSKYENIPVAVLKRYEEYIEKIKTYGIKIESKDFYINSLEKKEEVYSKKLLDLNSLRELEIKGIKRLVIENSIVTSSAQEYAKDKNIEIIKRR